MLYNTASPDISLESRLEQRAKLQTIIDEATEQLKAENDAIKDELMRLGVDELIVGDQKIVLSVRRGRASLDKGKLVELGVSTEVIEQATKHGADYLQLDVRAVK